MDAIRRLGSYFRGLAATREPYSRVPPFSILFDQASPDRYRNYTFPDDDADPGEESVAALIAMFEKNERTPRLEYIPALAPALEKALVRGGFTREGELPLMLCTKESLQRAAPPEQASCELALSPDALLEAAEVQNAAYGAGPASQADIERLQRTVDRGGLVGLVRRSDGLAIGSGLVAGPIDGVAEIAAVGVLDAERRKGSGAAVTAFLAGEALSSGIDLPFLMAAHEAEARIYRRIGFEPFATMLHVVREGT